MAHDKITGAAFPWPLIPSVQLPNANTHWPPVNPKPRRKRKGKEDLGAAQVPTKTLATTLATSIPQLPTKTPASTVPQLPTKTLVPITAQLPSKTMVYPTLSHLKNTSLKNIKVVKIIIKK